MALSIDQYLATGEVAGPRQVLLTGTLRLLRRLRMQGRRLDLGRRHRAALLSQPLRAPRVPEYAGDQMDDAKQDEIRAAFAAAFKTRTRDEWTAELAPNDTCVAPVLSIPELVERSAPAGARRVHAGRASRRRASSNRWRRVLAGGIREQPVTRVRPPFETDTQAILAEAGLAEAEISKLVEEGPVE